MFIYFLSFHQSLQTLPGKTYGRDSLNCPSFFHMLGKMLHGVDRFPTSFALLIFLGTAECSVCPKPAFLCPNGHAVLGSPSHTGLRMLLFPLWLHRAAPNPVSLPEPLDGADAELSVLNASSDLAW